MSTHADNYISSMSHALQSLDRAVLEDMARAVERTRDLHGRLFIVGLGGGAGHASHAVSDFRRLCHVDAHTPTDNVTQFTAEGNDSGWTFVFTNWLGRMELDEKDILLVFSVGGGWRGVSNSIASAVDMAKSRGALVLGVVGPDGGVTAKKGDLVIRVTAPVADLVTPITESLQAVVWHYLVSHPLLQKEKTKW